MVSEERQPPAKRIRGAGPHIGAGHAAPFAVIVWVALISAMLWRV